MNILRIDDLYKQFKDNKVINGISLKIPEGSVYGFIGANGAGKTTTMKMVLGLLKPDGGEIHICGERVKYGMTATNRFVGYLPDVPEYYNFMKPREYLKLCGEVVGLPSDEIKRRSANLLELVRLAKANKKIGQFSRGMKQRLGMAQALINEPKLLICDEPTSALDPMGRKEILDIMQKIKETTTVIFSTHILSDVERVCDRAAVLHGGKIIIDGTLAEIKGKHKSDGLMIAFDSEDDLTRFVEILPEAFLQNRKQNGAELRLKVSDVKAAQSEVFRVFAEHGIMPARFAVSEPTIENLYLEATK
jgi:ABC-2 type transport system ATP-binding protein